MPNELLERLAEEVHNSWWDERKRQGFVDPIPGPCPLCGGEQVMDSEKTKLFCYQGHTYRTHKDMMPYSELEDWCKEYDRATVRGVVSALNKMGIELTNKQGFIIKLVIDDAE